MFFMFMYFISFFLVINSDDWFMLWLGLEINMMGFIVLVYHRFSFCCIEASLKYFFVQSLGSGVFMSFWYMYGESLYFFMLIMLSYKMGVGPFYLWFPSVCSGLDWAGCFILMSIQKIVPLFLMMMFISSVVGIIILSSLVLGAYGSFNQKSIKELLAYSSIHHIGWLLMISGLENEIWVAYWLMYCFIILGMMFYMNEFESQFMYSLMKWKSKWSFLMLMFSMSGLPPLLGFFMKWVAFYYIMKSDFVVIIFMIIMSVVMFYIYFRIVYDLMMGIVYKGSWDEGKVFENYFLSIDMLSIYGIFLGCVICMFIML